MSLLKYVVGLALVAGLAACGGGGGSAGTPSGSSGSTSTTAPTVTLSIVDASGVAVASNAISGGALFYVKAVVKNASGTAVANKLLTFTSDSTVAVFAQNSALTDASGVAKVQITPVNISANAGNLVVSATVDSLAVSSSIDYQTSAANVSLTNLVVAPNSINALQSSAVSVEGRINNVLAGSSAVVVNFSASCGQFSPTSASTNSSGIASTSYQAAANCSGSVTLTAQATGATALNGSIAVAAAQPVNVVFNSSTVPLMVASAASGGLKQSTLKFQVLDATGGGKSGVKVLVSLNPATISSGVTFTLTGNTVPQTVTTDADGFVSVTVSSGSLPTPVVVTAALTENSAVQASATGVAVTAGRATQNAASLSATKLSIEAFSTDGVQTTLTMRVADRQGNPVPAGSTVNFVASHGLVQGTCALDAASQCSVTYTSQGLRPTNGRVAILAYMDGEESFLDQNGDNIWQSGEPFYDVGLLYRDDDENLVYQAATEQTYPGGSTGSNVCSSDVYSYPSVSSTCDGTWSSSIRVRRQITIALATKEANITLASARTSSGFTVTVTDKNGNAMPTGTTVSSAVKTNGATCTVSSTSPDVVNNSANGGNHRVQLDAAADCTTVGVDVTVTTPSLASTVVRF